MKVLIVDDNASDRRLLRLNLERHGCETVIEARDGREGLELAGLYTPDLIISDALMPRMDGFEFLREVYCDVRLKTIPFVFHSSVYTGLKDKQLALSLGAVAFIAKPMEPEAFWEELSAVLERCTTSEEPPLPREPVGEEMEYLRRYSGVVAAKLEEKVRDLEETLEKLKKTLNYALDTMVKIVELRDPYTAGHQKRVSILTLAIAGEMNLAAERIDHLYMAARVHDIGKINIPAEILCKPGRLSTLEFEMVKTHAQSGYNIVENMHFDPEVAEIILQHHEKLDGSGYPRNLKGEEIMLEARILCVADFVEAVANHRPYRAALGIDEAMDEILKDADTLFDSLVVAACVTLFREKGFKFAD